MTQKIYVVVKMFQGVLDTIKVYRKSPTPADTSDEFWDNGHKTFGPYDLQDGPQGIVGISSVSAVGEREAE